MTTAIDAERVVLGTLMADPSCLDAVTDRVATGDFQHPAHQVVFAHLVAAVAKGEPSTPDALRYSLLATRELDAAGGALHLVELYEQALPGAMVGFFAAKVADAALRDRLVVAGTRIAQRASDEGCDTSEALNFAQQQVLDVVAPRTASRLLSLREALDDSVDRLLGDQPRRGLSTGLGSLDEVVGGLKPGQLTLVAGRPSCGKSVLCVDFARAAVRRSVPAALFSLEMHRDEVVARILAAEASVNLFRLLNGGLSPVDRDRVNGATTRLRPLPMHIDATRAGDLASIRSATRRLRSRVGLGLVVVDYLQLMTSTTRRDSRALELAEISRGLKLLAGDLEVPIVAAAQVNRQPETRADKRPQLSDLRESGSLEADADIVILIHRPDQYDAEHERAGEADLIVAKNRNGPLETVTVAAQLEHSRFVDIGVSR